MGELDVSARPETARVLAILKECLQDERHRVTVSRPVRMCAEASVTVENSKRLNVTALVRRLPESATVYVRDADGKASRVEVCYALRPTPEAATTLAVLALVGSAIATVWLLFSG